MKIRPIDAEIFKLLAEGTLMFQSFLSILHETAESTDVSIELKKNLFSYQNRFQKVFYKFTCEMTTLQQHVLTMSILISAYCNSSGREIVIDDAYIIKKNFETELQPFKRNFTQVTILKDRLEALIQNDLGVCDQGVLTQTLKDLMRDFNHVAGHLEYLE